MSGFFLHNGALVACPHGGSVSVITGNNRVFVNKQPVATITDSFVVSGCHYTDSVAPSQCLTIKWLFPAKRVFVNGKNVILSNSVGVCQNTDQVPQGPPNVLNTQLRVKGR